MKRAVQKQHVCSDCNYIKEHMHIGPDEILYIYYEKVCYG